jgi:outer membrane protein assembly factor BamA
MMSRVLSAVALAAGLAMSAGAAKEATYILNGYSLSGIKGVNTAELQAKLKHKPGDRITAADVNADQATIAKELEARHVRGLVVATLAEKRGRAWIIFDLLDVPTMRLTRQLETQNFEGASHISAGVLGAATGLKKGDQLSPKKINEARQSILALYAKSMPGKPPSLRVKMRITQDGKTTLTWIIAEAK